MSSLSITTAIQLGEYIRGLISRLHASSELQKKLEDEQRTTLTMEELTALQANDDASRDALVAAIGRAEGEGR
jgi:hypothetical protein